MALVAGLVWTARRPRTDRTRAALILWGATLLLTGLTISLSQGIIHTYYTVALAPAVGALLGIGAHLAWKLRAHLLARLVTVGAVAVSAWWAWALLDRSPSWLPWLRPLVVVTGAVASLLIVVGGRRKALAMAAAGIAGVTLLSGPVAYGLNTISTPHTGSLPTAGPRVSSGFGPGAGNGGAGGPGGTAGGFPGGTGTGTAANRQPPTGTGAGRPTGGFGGTNGPGGGGAGGLLNASTPSAALVTTLQADAGTYDWIVATVGANSAAGYQLATGDAVLAIGGFNGSDDAPTLAQFKVLVANGRIHYFIGGGGFGGQSGGSNAGTEIASWVEANFTTTTVASTTLFDLTQPTAN